MAVGLLLISLAVIGIACAGFSADLSLQTTCDRAGVVTVGRSFFLALMANQSTYQLTKPKTTPAG
jgi:hypothetical protein